MVPLVDFAAESLPYDIFLSVFVGAHLDKLTGVGTDGMKGHFGLEG